MNKTELISAMAERSGLSKKDTEKALTAALETIAAALAAGDRVQLVGFGTFELRERLPITQPPALLPDQTSDLLKHSCRPPACV